MKLNLTQHNYNMKNKEEIANKHGILSGKDSELDDAILKAMQEYANQCQEDMADKKYTLEDIENAFNSGKGYGVPNNIKDFNSFINSLNKQD